MRTLICVFLLVAVSLNGWSQIDTPTGLDNGIDIPFGTDTDSPNISNTSLTTKNFGIEDPESKTGFGQFMVKDTLAIGQTEEKGIQFTTDNGLLTRKMDAFTPKYFTKDKEVEEKYRKNQYFGEYKSEAKYIVLRCRDHEFVDGDRVKIYLNDKVILPGVLLEGSYREFELDLEPGMNTVEIEALNQGTSGPNTAELVVIDDKGVIIFQNEWNLATGVSAKFVVTRPRQ